jgi:sRNA-binding regulator protein Hfq
MGRFDCFIYFFVLQETQKETSEAVSLDAFLMNGYKITVKIMSTDQTEDVLEV